MLLFVIVSSADILGDGAADDETRLGAVVEEAALGRSVRSSCWLSDGLAGLSILSARGWLPQRGQSEENV